MKNFWNKLKINSLVPVRIGALIFILFGFAARITHADVVGSIVSFATGSIVGVIGEIGVVILDIVSFFLSLAQTLFQFALLYNLRFGNKLEVIQIGWGISRDIANIFFIVVLLVIAIATILRIGSYTAKQLLPSLIIMAILINFSLSIGLVVVDVSNTLGLQFYNAITDNNTKTVSSLIMQGTGVQHVFDFKKPDASVTENFARGVIQTGVETVSTFVSPKLMEGIAKGDTTAFAITAWGNAIFMSILVFVFFVAAVILLIRVAVISMLLMLAPLAFLFYILPDTKSHWNKWWNELIKNCFFLPAFLFLLYFAIVFILKVGLANAGASGNFVDNWGLIFGYLLAIILLMQALILGRSMGAMGASTAIGWAKSGRKMATGFVAGQTIGRASNRLLASPGVKEFVERQRPWIGRRLQGYLEKGATTGGRQKSAEATAAFVSRQTTDGQVKAWEKMSFAEKQALLRKLNPEQSRRLINGLPDEQKKLAERILGTSLAADQKADLDASQYQRMQGTEEQKREAYAGLSREAKERVLRTMDQNQRADFVQKLRNSGNSNLVAAANTSEDIIGKDFAPNEFTAYKVAQFNNDSAENQLGHFNNPNDPMLDDRTRAMILLSKKDDEREAFLGKLTDRRSAEKIMKDHFPPEKLMEVEAARVAAIKDPQEQQMAFLALKNTNPKAYESILRKKNDQQRALFLSGITSPTDKKDAEDALKNILTPSEYAKYEAQAFLLKPLAEQAAAFSTKDPISGQYVLDKLTREELLRQKKDPNAQALFVANLQNINPESEAAALAIVNESLSPDEAAAYKSAAWNLLPPEKQAEAFMNADPATQEKIIRSLVGERKAVFLTTTLDKNQRAVADKIIKENFSLDERAAIYAEEWKLQTEKEDKINFFANADGDIKMLAQEKILANFKDADERERFVSDMEKSTNTQYKTVAGEARTLLNSTRFTATQRSEFKKARTKQEVSLADNASLLTGYFMLEQDPKKRAEMLEVMNERQQLDMFEEAKRGPASMAMLSETILKMKPNMREELVTKTISRASNEAIIGYFAQKDAEIQANAEDTQKQDELRGEKKRAFKGLRGDTKAEMWAAAWTSKDERKMEGFKELLAGSSPTKTELASYHSALGRVLGDKIVSSPDEASDMYSRMDKEAIHQYLQSKQGRGLVSQLHDSTKDNALQNAIKQDFAAAGQKNTKEYEKLGKKKNPKQDEEEEEEEINEEEKTAFRSVANENWRANKIVSSEISGIGSLLKRGVRNDTARVGVDFDTLGYAPNAIGANIGQSERPAVIGKIVEQLRTQGTYSEGEIAVIEQRLSSARNLTLLNKGQGWDARGTIVHESSHDSLDVLGNEKLKELWSSIPEKDRDNIRASVKRTWQGDLSEEDVMNEYFAEGIKNASQYGTRQKLSEPIASTTREAIAKAGSAEVFYTSDEYKNNRDKYLSDSDIHLQLSDPVLKTLSEDKNYKILDQKTVTNSAGEKRSVYTIPNIVQPNSAPTTIGAASSPIPSRESNQNIQTGSGALPSAARSAPTARTAPTPQAKAEVAQPTKEVGGVERKIMDQGAVKEAREASRVESDSGVTLSPKIQKVIEQSPEKAIKGYMALPKEDQVEMMKKMPQNLIAMKEAASDTELSIIENNIQQSSPAKTWRSATNPTERLNALSAMPINDKKIAFEAIASSNNPQEMKTLRAAVSSMPEAQQKEFVADVVTQGSLPAAQKYLKEVVEEKVTNQKVGKVAEVEKLAQEETTITKAVDTKVKQKTSQTVPSTEKASAPTARTAPTPQAKAEAAQPTKEVGGVERKIMDQGAVKEAREASRISTNSATSQQTTAVASAPADKKMETIRSKEEPRSTTTMPSSSAPKITTSLPTPPPPPPTATPSTQTESKNVPQASRIEQSTQTNQSTPLRVEASSQNQGNAARAPQSSTPRSVDGIKPSNGSVATPPSVTTNQNTPTAARISTETAAQAVDTAKRARGEIQTNKNLNKTSDEVIAAEIAKGDTERQIEKENMTPHTTAPSEAPVSTKPVAPTKFVTGEAASPQGVGAKAKEDIAESKEEALDRELEDIATMESELSSTAIDEARLTKMLQKIDGKILLLESLQRAKEETGGDTLKIQALSNIVARLNTLKTKAETKMRELKNK